MSTVTADGDAVTCEDGGVCVCVVLIFAVQTKLQNVLSLLYDLLRTAVAPLESRCVWFTNGRFEALLFRRSEGLH